MGKEENEVQKDILGALNAMPETWAHRNNTGRRGNVSYGLGVGSSDIIGYTSVTITPEMVGTKVAVFTAVEVKKLGGKPTLEQLEFNNAISVAGGIAFVADSMECFIENFQNCMQKIKG